MTKEKDFRIQYPLWQMAFIILLFVISLTKYGLDSDNLYKDSLMLAQLVVLIILFAVFMIKVRSHNRKHPGQRLSLWQVRPYEFLEQDEGMEWITKRATQKVYTFFVWALPILAGIFFSIPPKPIFTIGSILFLAAAQYFIFYREVQHALIGANEE